MKENKLIIWLKQNYEIIISAIIGMSVFIYIYGIDVINPIYVDWLMQGENDLSQHYYGWKFFRQDAWRFPIGLMENLTYPTPVSVIYTDSIPLFAVFFKIFSPLLPSNFQYFGIFGVISYILQGVLSAILIKKYLKSKISIILGGCFFIFSPIIMQRMFIHTSLAGNWVILLLMAGLVYRDNIRSSSKKLLFFWGTMGLVCVGIHFYFILMGAFIWTGFLLLDIIENRNIICSMKAGTSYFTVSVLTMFLLGGFSNVISPKQKGLGDVQFDLSAFWSPMGNSFFMKNIFYTENFESFAYLGFGIILLVFCGIIIRVVKKKRLFLSYKHWVLVFVALISIVFAASNVIIYNGKVLFEVSIPDCIYKLWSIFRATARFSWLPYYFILLYAICGCIRIIRVKYWNIILLACLILQLTDLQGMIKKIQVGYEEPYLYSSRLKDIRWQELGENGKYKHVVLITEFGHELIYDFAEYASNYQMTTNRFYLARPIDEKIVRSNIQRALERESRDVLFVVAKEDATLYEQYGIRFEIIDNRAVGIKEE